MDSMSLRSGLTLRLLVVGIPKHSINPLSRIIERWVTCSGEEWAVSRLKTLKNLLIHDRSGIPLSIPLARNRRGEYKGIIGYLIRYSRKDDKCFTAVINAFMAYSNWTSSHVTISQRKKFLEAVQSTPRVSPENLKDLIKKSTRKVIQLRTVNTCPSPLVLWRGSPSKRAPTPFGSRVQSDHLLCELALTRNQKTLEHIQSLWDPIYKSVFKGLNIHRFIDDTHEDDISYGDMVGGEVHFLQEPGYKLRSIASPYRLFQVASEPLKNDLKCIVSSLPWDCTHDQGRAFSPVQVAISAGRRVHSVDLSNATDYFPLDLQETVLQTVYGIGNPYCRLFRDISRSSFQSEMGVIKWNNGQPLGFGPSFFLFTLTHGLLLYGLNGYRWSGEFYVVGDDVVILDDTLYRQYINCLQLLGCPYSPTKSISSCKLAEFAGKLILPTTIIPQLKWRDVSDNNFIDLARLIGPRIRSILSKRQRKVLDVFAHVPDFIHPYGLNWSYPGSNLGKMIEAGLGLAFEQSVLSSLTGLSESVHRQLYADYGYFTYDLKGIILADDIRDEIRTFDEKVRSVFLKVGFARKFSSEYFLEGLKDIPEARVPSQGDTLPLESRPPSRVTLLDRLYQFLRY